MLGKKLLTLACAAGILAFGACFGPIHEPSPRPPLPPRIDLQGIQSIQVVVKNVSESHHLDPSALAHWVAININSQTRGAGVKAHVRNEAGVGDAVLEIAVVSESATPPPDQSAGGAEEWSFQFKIAATLTKQDGQVIWRETDAEYPVSFHCTSENSADAWKDPNLQNLVPSALGPRLVRHMFYGY